MSNLVIGAGDGSAIHPGDDVIVMPYENVPMNTGATIHVVTNLHECLKVIRARFATHEQLATLGSTAIKADHPTMSEALRAEWLPAIHGHLEMMLDDMGNDAVDSWDGARNAIKQGAYLSSCPNTDSLHNALAGCPAICLAAGPSAESRIAQINPETHYVFTVDAMANGLPFVPHYVCAVERIPGTFEMMQASAGNGARLIAPPVIDPRAAVAFNGKCLWWMGSDPIYRWLSPEHSTAFCGRSCGTLSIAAALLAGCNPIYLVGHDLAYANGTSHCTAVHPIAPLEHQGPVQTETNMYHYRRFQVEANGGGTVQSMGLWSLFRQDIELLLSFYPDRTVINCGGLSKIRGTVMGELQTSPFIVREPNYLAKPIHNWLADVPRIVENMHRIKDRCARAIIRLEMDADTAAIANSLAVSSIVEPDMCLLFNYVFRALSNNLNLRLHYRATHGYDADKAYRSVLRSLALTMHALCEKMEVELVA